jgi:hypothetical protein
MSRRSSRSGLARRNALLLEALENRCVLSATGLLSLAPLSRLPLLPPTSTAAASPQAPAAPAQSSGSFLGVDLGAGLNGSSAGGLTLGLSAGVSLPLAPLLPDLSLGVAVGANVNPSGGAPSPGSGLLGVGADVQASLGTATPAGTSNPPPPDTGSSAAGNESVSLTISTPILGGTVGVSIDPGQPPPQGVSQPPNVPPDPGASLPPLPDVPALPVAPPLGLGEGGSTAPAALPGTTAPGLPLLSSAASTGARVEAIPSPGPAAPAFAREAAPSSNPGGQPGGKELLPGAASAEGATPNQPAVPPHARAAELEAEVWKGALPPANGPVPAPAPALNPASPAAEPQEVPLAGLLGEARPGVSGRVPLEDEQPPGTGNNPETESEGARLAEPGNGGEVTPSLASLSPQGAGPQAEASPFDPALLERALRDFLDQVGELQDGLGSWLASPWGWPSVFMGLAVAAVGVEALKRRRRRARAGGPRLGPGEGDISSTWCASSEEEAV